MNGANSAKPHNEQPDEARSVRAMTLWPCFAEGCNSIQRCQHREPELLEWLDKLDREAFERAIALIEAQREHLRCIPPARETQPYLVRKANA